MSGGRSVRGSWGRLLIVLFLAFGVAVMYADAGLLGTFGSQEVRAVTGHDYEPMATTSGVPDPAKPTTPVEPCHHVGPEVCCVSALPLSVPRQLLALMVLAVAVVVGASQAQLLGRAMLARLDSPRSPPDLSALCVLRI